MERVARIVLREAADLPRYAETKVYLADVLMKLPGLRKEEILELHKAGFLRLSRCDLRQLADVERLDRGEIRLRADDDNAVFHFLVVE